MSEYRKKPVVIDAVQWFRDGDNPDVRPFLSGDWNRQHANCCIEKSCKECGAPTESHGWIETLEGGHIVCVGDWIITGVKGEKYPCKPDIFALTYESPTPPPPSETKLSEAIDAFENAGDDGVPEPVRTAARSSLESLFKDLQVEIEQLRAIHELIADDILFCHRDGGFVTSDDDKSALGYSVFCSDTFALACADAESITPDEVVALHRIMSERPQGLSQNVIAIAWVAWKRGLTRKDIAYQDQRESFPQEAFDYFKLRISSKATSEEL